MGDKQKTRINLEMRLDGGPLTMGMIVGILLVLAGTLMFIDNVADLPFRASRLFWPLALIGYGLLSALRSTSLAVRIWSGTAVLGGSLLLLQRFDLIRIRGDILWPLALIATGVVMLIYRMRWQPLGDGFKVGASDQSRSSEHCLKEYAVFSQVRRRIETPAFEGGELTSVFGGNEIDLRRAVISSESRRIILETNVAFGAIELRVPEDWRVSVEGTAVFGAFEDKTIPPRPEPGIITPVLVIRGGVAFGAVAIRN